MDEWRDMATAPRDGARILVTRRKFGTTGPALTKKVAIASWRHGGWDGGEAIKLWHIEVCANHYIVSDEGLIGWLPLPSPQQERIE